MFGMRYAVMGDDILVPVAVFNDLQMAIGFCKLMAPITIKVKNRITGQTEYTN